MTFAGKNNGLKEIRASAGQGRGKKGGVARPGAYFVSYSHLALPAKRGGGNFGGGGDVKKKKNKE